MDQRERGGERSCCGGDGWRWSLGLLYIVAVAAIWITASYIVQSVVDAGVSPFLITYICNSLFVIYIPLVEILRYFEDSVGNLWFLSFKKDSNSDVKATHREFGDSEVVNLLPETETTTTTAAAAATSSSSSYTKILPIEDDLVLNKVDTRLDNEEVVEGLDAKGRWSRTRIAKVSLLICPFWFFAQLTFNLSLKYTTVTSNTILSSSSSLFTFLVSLAFLGEKFTWMKLVSVLLCMGGTVIVSLGDSTIGVNAIATNPLFGDILALVSTCLYAVYITLIRVKLPDYTEGKGHASMAQFLGFLGMFNFLIFLPVALVLNFTGIESFHQLNWKQFGLIIGKGLLDNVLSDYLWAKAIQLTTTTVATAGLTIQVPLAALIDSLTGHAPNLMDYLGAASVMVGFVGINMPSGNCLGSQSIEKQEEDPEDIPDDGHALSTSS